MAVYVLLNSPPFNTQMLAKHINAYARAHTQWVYRVKWKDRLETVNMEDNIRYKGESDEMNRKKIGSSIHGRKKWKSTVSMVTGRGTVLVVACESGSEWNIRCTDTKTHTCFCHFGGHCIDTHQLHIEEPNLTHLTAQLTWHLTEKCNVYPMRCRFLSWKVSSHNENNAGTHTHMHTPVSLLIL